MIPARIERISDSEISITWNDRHVGKYTLRRLRDVCPCASCKADREEQKGKVTLPVFKPGEFEIRNITPVGQYAIQIVWGDGHGTGLYTYEYLRSLCECDECSARNLS